MLRYYVILKGLIILFVDRRLKFYWISYDLYLVNDLCRVGLV